MSSIDINEAREPSVLADFDTGYVLEELSFGIIVLDRQFCTVYANGIAQNLLALDLPTMRGRPLDQLLPQPQPFPFLLRSALERGVASHHTLRLGSAHSSEKLDSINVRIAPLSNQMYGAYVLVEMSDARIGGDD